MAVHLGHTVPHQTAIVTYESKERDHNERLRMDNGIRMSANEIDIAVVPNDW